MNPTSIFDSLVVGDIPNIAKVETLRIRLLIFSWTECGRILKGSNKNSSVLHKMWKSVQMLDIVSIILAFIILNLIKVINLQGIVLNTFHLFSPLIFTTILSVRYYNHSILQVRKTEVPRI